MLPLLPALPAFSQASWGPSRIPKQRRTTAWRSADRHAAAQRWPTCLAMSLQRAATARAASYLRLLVEPLMPFSGVVSQSGSVSPTAGKWLDEHETGSTCVDCGQTGLAHSKPVSGMVPHTYLRAEAWSKALHFEQGKKDNPHSHTLPTLVHWVWCLNTRQDMKNTPLKLVSLLRCSCLCHRGRSADQLQEASKPPKCPSNSRSLPAAGGTAPLKAVEAHDNNIDRSCPQPARLDWRPCHIRHHHSSPSSKLPQNVATCTAPGCYTNPCMLKRLWNQLPYRMLLLVGACAAQQRVDACANCDAKSPALAMCHRAHRLLWLLLWGAAASAAAIQQCGPSCISAQTAALTALYNATGGSGWLHNVVLVNGTAVPATQWLSPAGYCYWPGERSATLSGR